MLRHLRSFSTTRTALSNIGSAPIIIPKSAKLSLFNHSVDPVSKLRMDVDKMRNGKPKIYLTKYITVEGPRGKLDVDLADFIKINLENEKATVSVEEPKRKHQRSMWGTSRSLLANAVTGVTEGHLCIVKLVGTGFRAALDGNKLVLRVGFSIPRILEVPAGFEVKVPVPHRIIIEGADKQQIKLFAARLRAFRKPEPYKGKGIFIDEETIKLKQKKIK